jgi:hypothetical protein
MSTSKLLQSPKIIKIIGSTIYVAHPNTTQYVRTYLAAPIAAAGTAMTVYDNNGLSNGDYFVVGEPGDSHSEEDSVNGAVTRGQSLTVTNTLKFSHEVDAPVTKIFERAIKIYGAATDGGAGTLIASIDAITTPIADAFNIQWDKPWTEYTLITTDTTYAYYYAKFTDGVTDSTASTYVPSTGPAYNTIEPLIEQALDMTNSVIDDQKLTREMLVSWAQECQEGIQQFVYKDPLSGRFIQKDWSFELEKDSSLVLETNQDQYSLDDLNLKYPLSEKSIIGVKIGANPPLRKVEIQDYDLSRTGVLRTELTVASSVGATSITVDSTAGYNDSGTVVLGDDTLTYTGITSTTFTGIPASGDGSITAISAIGSPVFQNMTASMIQKYAFWKTVLYFDVTPESTYVGQAINIRFFKALDRLTKVSDTTEIPFTNVFPYYIASRIENRKGNTDRAKGYMEDWRSMVTQNAEADRVPLPDEYIYYNFVDPVYGEPNGYTNSIFADTWQ